MTNSYPFTVFGDEFKGKRVLVTGGTKGIGEAIDCRCGTHRSKTPATLLSVAFCRFGPTRNRGEISHAAIQSCHSLGRRLEGELVAAGRVALRQPTQGSTRLIMKLDIPSKNFRRTCAASVGSADSPRALFIKRIHRSRAA